MITDDFRNLADATALFIVIWAQWNIGAWMLAAAAKRSASIQYLTRGLLVVIAAWLCIGFALNIHTVTRILRWPASWRGIVSGGAYLWLFSSTGAYIAYRIWRMLFSPARTAGFNPGRRKLVDAVGNALVAAPFAVTGFGLFIQRTDFRVREVDIPIQNLPRDLQGLRVLQLTDMHMGPFLTERDMARVIDESLNLRPHLAVITGDLISLTGDPLDACLRQIARLRPDAGILGCMGNHEIYAQVEGYTTEQGARLGIDFLRGRARALKFGTATLNVAGVDYESIRNVKSYLTGAERLIAPGAVNVLLSHNPDVFPTAVGKGFDFTISGHTHGGQVTIEILHQTLNVARFITPFVSGYYRLGRSSVYVSRGIGTIGLPIRVGAPPEISLLRLVTA